MEISTTGIPNGIIKSLRTYDLTLANVSVMKECGAIWVDDVEATEASSFTDAEDCAIFIQAKYSGGLKPHRHVWDLSINNMIQPAYTVGCLIPGCQSRLTLPHPWRKTNEHDEEYQEDMGRDKLDRDGSQRHIQEPSSKDQTSTRGSRDTYERDGASNGALGGERGSHVRPEPAPREPTGIAIDVWPAVMGDMATRNVFGTKKYGTPLQTFNGRAALVDAYQEALDLVVYLKQQILEDEHEQT